MHLTRHRKGTINHENEHNVATILAYYPPDSTIYSKRSIHPPSWRIDPCCSREVRVNKYVYAILVRLDNLLQNSLLFRQLLIY